MSTITHHHTITNRIEDAAPHLKFVACYHYSEDQLLAYMQGYKHRAFVYILTMQYQDNEHFLYVGKTKSQYTRLVQHTKKYAFDKIYLFECEPEHLSDSESAVIAEFKPLFNKIKNPLAYCYEKLLGINYDAQQDAVTTQCYLNRLGKYSTFGLFGFALPVALYTALNRRATAENCRDSDVILSVLEKELEQDVADILANESLEQRDTNLISAEAFGELHERSKEQVKQYLRQRDRIPGGVKVGRDWVIPFDTPFPEDRRGRRLPKSNEEPRQI